MTWQALGDYRGPFDGRWFARYALELARQRERREVYRIYITESIRALVGGDAHYHELAGIYRQPDFDAEDVADRLATAICSGGE